MKRSSTIAAAIGFGIICAQQRVQAHRLDEYLQATLITIQTNAIQVEVCLTPGVSVVPDLLSRLDVDSNRLISTNEAQSYAEAVRSELTLRLNNRALPLQLGGIKMPEPEEMGSGDAIIRLDFSSPLVAVPTGTNSLTFTNRHLPNASIYLLNTTHPASPTIQIRKQLRSSTQSGGETTFTYNPPGSPSTTLGWLICGGAFVSGALASMYGYKKCAAT